MRVKALMQQSVMGNSILLASTAVIDTSVVSSLNLIGALCFIIPLVALVIIRVKTKAKLTPFFAGIVTFVMFAQLLENLLHAAVIGGEGTAVYLFFQEHPLVYALYVGLAAGIFEETGRLLVMRFIINGYNQKTTALTFGIGHGGVEAVLVLGLSYISTGAFAKQINTLGIAGYVEQLNASGNAVTIEEMTSAIAEFGNFSVFNSYMALLERCSAMILQVALSVLVFMALRYRKKWLFPLAIGLHALIDVFAALYQAKVVTSITVLEILVLIYAVAVFVFALYLLKKEPNLSDVDPMAQAKQRAAAQTQEIRKPGIGDYATIRAAIPDENTEVTTEETTEETTEDTTEDTSEDDSEKESDKY